MRWLGEEAALGYPEAAGPLMPRAGLDSASFASKASRPGLRIEEAGDRPMKSGMDKLIGEEELPVRMVYHRGEDSTDELLYLSTDETVSAVESLYCTYSTLLECSK